jgi:hypothetical protein
MGQRYPWNSNSAGPIRILEFVTLLMKYPSSPELRISTYGAYQPPVNIQQSQLITPYSKAPSPSLGGSAYEKVGHLTSVTSSCGWLLIIVAGLRTG